MFGEKLCSSSLENLWERNKKLLIHVNRCSRNVLSRSTYFILYKIFFNAVVYYFSAKYAWGDKDKKENYQK